jgi:hypothetical protein
MPFRATIDKAGLCFPTIHAAARWQAWMEGHEGARVVIEEVKPGRSTSQNSYYWMYLGVIERETGQLATDVHEWAKRKFLPPRFIKVNGEEMKIPGSTTELDKASFTYYLDRIAAETNIPLPDIEAAGYISNTKPLVTKHKDYQPSEEA